jgi:hypothetical protein
MWCIMKKPMWECDKTVREDLTECGIRPHSWLQLDGTRFIKHVASNILSDEKKSIFLNYSELKNTYTLCVFMEEESSQGWRPQGIKSHNFHVMMQDILSLCMQHLMAKGCRMVIIHLNHVSKKLCNKVVDPNTIANLKEDVAMTMVLLEQQFLLSFFDIMTHLLIHLIEELNICSTVHTR